MQIKWNVLHSPKFVSLMIFLVQTSVPTCSNHCQTSRQKKTSSQLSFFLFQFFFFWWVGTSKTATLFVWAFFNEATDLVAPQRSHICSNGGIKDFTYVTNRKSVYPYLPYTVFCGFILLSLFRIWLHVNFQFFLISNIIKKSCKI